MADDIQPDAASDLVCTWCSAPLGSADLVHCPSCGANLHGDIAEPLPGVTAVDAAALVRGTPTAVRPRNRLLSWISGDYPDEGATEAEAKALEPPDPAVRREMLRLELEGEVANLKAEADALVAEAAAEGRVVEPPVMTALSESGVAAAEAALIGDDEVPETAEAVEPESAEAAAAVETVEPAEASAEVVETDTSAPSEPDDQPAAEEATPA